MSTTMPRTVFSRQEFVLYARGLMILLHICGCCVDRYGERPLLPVCLTESLCSLLTGRMFSRCSYRARMSMPGHYQILHHLPKP